MLHWAQPGLQEHREGGVERDGHPEHGAETPPEEGTPQQKHHAMLTSVPSPPHK